jgi:transcriptional regulator with PAS, ATPase and Fis domain
MVLDEIGEFTTNRDLTAAIAEGGSDLFYRMNVFLIEVSPLRKRKEDMFILVEYFVSDTRRKAADTFATSIYL